MMVYMYYGFFLFLLYMTAPWWVFLPVAAGSWWAMRSSTLFQKDMKISLGKLRWRATKAVEYPGELQTNPQKFWVERRKFDRLPASLQVTYQVLEEDLEKEKALPLSGRPDLPAPPPAKTGNGLTHDISEGGLSITSEIPFTVGQQVRISLQFPESKASAVLVAEVRSCRASFKEGRTIYKAGLKIVAVDLEDMVQLTGYLFDERPHKQAS